MGILATKNKAEVLLKHAKFYSAGREPVLASFREYDAHSAEDGVHPGGLP